MKFDGMPLEVSLRDDPSIRGICKEFAGTQLCLSSDAFGSFGTEAKNFIEKEDVSAPKSLYRDIFLLDEREQRLEEQRVLEQGEVGGLVAFFDMELLPLRRIAGVPQEHQQYAPKARAPGDLPHCSARELHHGSCALPRSGLPLLLHLPNQLFVDSVVRCEGPWGQKSDTGHEARQRCRLESLIIIIAT